MPCLNHQCSAALPWRAQNTHHDLTSYLTLGAFHKMLVGWEGPPQSLWKGGGEKGLVWAQLPTRGDLVLKGQQCEGRGSSGGVS